MADQVYTVALDDKGFSSGLSRIERQNKLVSDRVEAAWGRQGKSIDGKWGVSIGKAAQAVTKFGASAAAAMAVATRAIDAYSAAFPGALDASQNLGAAVKDLNVELGRNYVASGMAATLTAVAKAAGEALNATIDFVNIIASGGAEDGLGENRAMQREIEAQEQRKVLLAETIDLQIAAAEAEGRWGDAADLRRNKQNAADQNRINELGKGLSSNDPAVEQARAAAAAAARGRRAKLGEQVKDNADELAADAAEASGDTIGAKNIREGIRLRKQMRGFDALEAQGADVSGLRDAARQASAANRVRIASEDDSPAARAFKAAREQDKARADQSGQLQQAAELRRIEQLALEGHEKEAALARVRLDYARQRAEIEEKDLVTSEEKFALLEELAGQEKLALQVTGESFKKRKVPAFDSPTLAAGMGAAARHVFGVGGSGSTPAAKQLAEAQKQTRVLERIEKNTATAGGAEYGA